MTHPASIPGYDNVKEVAEAIRRLRYDALRDLLSYLAEGFQEDSTEDMTRGRQKLSNNLCDLAIIIEQAENKADDIWNVCQPYVKNRQDEKDSAKS